MRSQLTMRIGIQTVILVLLFLHRMALAQAGTPRFEAGPIFTCFTGCADQGNRGFGGRGTVNITKLFGAEFQVTRLESRSSFVDPVVYGSGHGKITLRLEDKLKFNAFGVAGPGFFSNDRFVGKLPGPVVKQRTSSFAFNFGGGIEIVPLRFASARFDFANFSSHSKCLDTYCDQVAYRNDFDLKVALMLRFR